ncbi:MAG TPA: universal stress protein [Cryobacterium sp.]|nr:universal stress protein [Cryobacterium sp.]
MSTYYVGFDGSDPSRSAIRWALARAEADGSPVILVHVVDDEWGLLGPDYAREAERRAGSLLAQEVTAAQTHAGLKIGALVLHGSPAWALAAVPTSGDVLVVGTHKTGTLHGRVLGSRSVQIAAAAACTVVVVPEPTVTGRRGVVVGVDRFEGSTSAVIRGAREAHRLGQELTLVHTPSILGAEPGAAALPESTRAAEQVLEAAARLATATTPGVLVRPRLVHEPPAEALLNAGSEAALLVVGVSHPRPVTQSVIGSVTHDVLMNITVPVLVARSD